MRRLSIWGLLVYQMCMCVVLTINVNISWFINNTKLKMSTQKSVATDRATIYTQRQYQE